jgi:hypothetical protein
MLRLCCQQEIVVQRLGIASIHLDAYQIHRSTGSQGKTTILARFAAWNCGNTHQSRSAQLL